MDVVMNEANDIMEVVDGRGQSGKEELLIDRSTVLEVGGEIVTGHVSEQDAGDTVIADAAAVIAEYAESAQVAPVA